MIEEELLEIVKEAIESEKRSQLRYERALSRARRPETRAMFEALLAEEREHERLLHEKYEDIKKQLGLKIMHKGE